MKAIVITQPGGPEVLEWREVEDPAFSPQEVLVRVHATALNRADVLQRMGKYPAPPDAPADIPGLEFAGVVESVGSWDSSVVVDTQRKSSRTNDFCFQFPKECPSRSPPPSPKPS